jgi:hypothetical protein
MRGLILVACILGLVGCSAAVTTSLVEEAKIGKKEKEKDPSHSRATARHKVCGMGDVAMLFR